MDLSPESFAALSAELASASRQTIEDERRRSRRIEKQASVPIALIIDGQRRQTVPTTVRDLSPRGISIVAKAPLAYGDQFVAELVGKDRQTISLLCNVMHCRAIDGGLHSIGAEFLCVVPPAGV